ncbi:hypothetical protein [Methylovorus glucosotrophus]|uniref:hypothetical protein n=1 Tax=Methylovorus glucosotrophus TaxID=266009 RepID=UPI001331554E|nr:hypothetical protein [Methylovorus glucosotrophus]
MSLDDKTENLCEAFANQLSFPAWYQTVNTDEAKKLIDFIATIKKDILDPHDAHEVLVDSLFQLIIVNKINVKESKLEELPKYKNWLKIYVKDYIQSLPRNYKLIINLPSFQTWGKFDFELIDFIHFRATENLIIDQDEKKTLANFLKDQAV